MVRCAIYTRKSHEEGLEQDFNSLDAQRAACAAYIASQKHEGWIALPTGYDDGGVSGATLARPALRRLLADIENGRVDVIVVYKVDRLTRALSDFARMVEVFDRKAVSFVSVTQQFNTTTSMGRLTLNVLLSFAQFEREVTGERIRDKIAASKKRGLWMGGNPPLGYDVEDRKLIVNETEAETVRHIFRQYREIKSVRELRRRLQAQGVTSKRRVVRDGRVTGDKPLNRGALYHLLHNRIYRGEIVHRERSYPGDHEAIVDQALWDEAQTILATNTHGERREGTRQPSLLTGPCRRRTWRGPHAEPRGQKRTALPLLCLPPPHPRGQERRAQRLAHAGRGSRGPRRDPPQELARRPCFCERRHQGRPPRRIGSCRVGHSGAIARGPVARTETGGGERLPQCRRQAGHRQARHCRDRDRRRPGHRSHSDGNECRLRQTIDV